MEWNVYLRSMNTGEIKPFNVFTHSTFLEKVKCAWDEADNITSFAEEVRHAAMYHFWSKCEYEVVITDWPPTLSIEELERLNKEHKERPNYKHVCPRLEGIKIDVYDQLKLNWNQFISYTWNEIWKEHGNEDSDR